MQQPKQRGSRSSRRRLLTTAFARDRATQLSPVGPPHVFTETPNFANRLSHLPTASVERTISDLVRSNEDPSLVGNFITGVCRRGHIIDEARLAELLSPLSSRNGFKKDDGASFARKLVSDFADAVQMQLVADSFMRALEASPSYQQIADQMAKLAQAFASSIPTFELPDYSQLPAMKAMTQLQEAFEPLAQFSDRITDRLRETLQITAALTPHVANLQSLKDGGPIDEVQDSEGT